MIEVIKQKLQEYSNASTQAFSKKIIPTKLPILGVTTPMLRKMAHTIVKQDFRQFLQECDQSSYELVLLEGIVVATCPVSLEERFGLLDNFLPKIENWAVHDGLVTSLKCCKKYPKEMLHYLMRYQYSKQEYEVRFVAVTLMCYYLNEEYVLTAFQIIKGLYLEAFYAKMGVAWFLATAIVNYPEYVFAYLDQQSDKELLTMTIRKVRDSYRVSAEIKEKIIQYKK